ncbi:hypothetical protein FOCG_17613 [Fusarium oxysporum f. sp. radicis-lycopersici 26381]|nr:hypothetical protein FOCG_17613 [Fusarium oxysporum f. sp. radicis-lycopersici 26381]
MSDKRIYYLFKPGQVAYANFIYCSFSSHPYY